MPSPECGPYHLEACASCGHVVTRPEPREGELAALYGEAYYGPEHRRFVGPLELATSAFRRWRARDIARRRAPGTFLDIGCGSGLLAASVARHGWRVMGTELSDESARHAREVLGVPVVTGEFPKVELPPASVDVVTMWQTFEHMREPTAVLKRINEVLRPGGWLIVSVPNRESWQARFAGPRWFHLDVPRHLHHYGESTLRRMLEAASFRVDRVSHFNWEQNPFGWLQSMIDVASGTQNSLFDVIRGAGSSKGGRRWAAIAALVASPILVPAAFGLALAESLARRGGTITVWASK